MPDTMTSAESDATVLDGSELLRIVQSASSKKTTAELIGHQFRGARVRMTSDDTAQNLTAGVVVTFDAIQFDTDAFWSAGSPTRLTIPAGLGITHVVVTGQVWIDLGTTSTFCSVYITHYNSAAVQQTIGGIRQTDMGSVTHALQAHTGPLAVSDGDYFTLSVLEESDASVTVKGTFSLTFLALQVIGMAP